MKKMIFFALTIFAFVSCSNQPKYTVKGTVSDASYNGKQIVFNKFEKGTIVPDTVTIEDNAFIWKGGIDTARMITAYVLAPESQSFQLVLEKGDINVTIENGKFKVGGSPMNDLLQEYTNKEAEAYKKANALAADYQAKVNAGTATEEEVNKYNQEYAVLNQEFGKYSMDFIKANINNVVGKTLFVNKIIYMGPKEKEEMLSFATDDLKEMYAPKN